MPDSFDITITLRIRSVGDIPAGTVIAAMDALGRTIFQEEEREIDALESEFRDWPSPVFDAMRYRLRRIGDGRALNIERASNGSLILMGAAAGLAYWLADKTLGETVKDAWKESASHERLKTFLKSRVFAKRDRIAHRFAAARFRMRDEFEVIEVTTSPTEPSIEIAVTPSQRNATIPRPSRQDTLANGEA